MREELDERKVRRIWDHAVLPYIEEHLFGAPDRLRKFQLDSLRGTETGSADSEPAPDNADEQDGGNAAS